MQRLFCRFQHDPAMPVHDGLGVAGGARRVDDPQRMFERHLTAVQRRRAVGQRGEIDPSIRQRMGHRHHDAPCDRWQPLADLLDHSAAVHRLAGVGIAVLRDQHLGFDLGKPVQNSHMAHIGRT